MVSIQKKNRQTTAAFDHCFTPDFNHAFLARLAKSGFTIDESVVEHPGRRICRFILFSSPRRKLRQYLEFVSQPRSNGRTPGLSFRSDGPLIERFAAVRGNPCLAPVIEHRPYDWKKGASNGPGWNFMRFGRKCRAAEIWFTEYESRDGKKRRWKSSIRHENGASGVLSLIFGVNTAGRRYFEALLGRKIDFEVRLSCGTKLILERARENKFRGVLLKSADFKIFCSRAMPDCVRSFRGRRTAVFRNPVGSWDLLVI